MQITDVYDKSHRRSGGVTYDDQTVRKARREVNSHEKTHRRLERLIGTWAFNGIQCEACHGPGSEHARTGDKTKITIDTSAASCGTCHSRGTDMAVIPAKDGFIEHHEQYQDPTATMFTEDGKFAQDFLTLDYACLACHAD